MRGWSSWLTAAAVGCGFWFTGTAGAVPGDVDTTYGAGGYFLSTINDNARGSAMQADGKLLLAASCPRRSPLTGATFCVSRLTTAGILDTTFGSLGRAVFQVGDTNSIAEQAVGIAVQADGKIVVGGQCSSGAVAASCVARLLSDGTLDSSFGTGGKLFLSGIRWFGAVQTLPGPKVLVAGGCGVSGPISAPPTMCVAKLNADGSSDGTFGTSGTYVFPALNGGGNDVAMAIAVRGDGLIAVAGRCTASALVSSKACIGMLTAAGTPDASVVGQSLSIVTFIDNSNTHNSLETIAWRVDGALISAGRCKVANGSYGLCSVYLNLGQAPGMQQAQVTSAVATWGIGSDPDVFVGMVSAKVLPDGRTLVAFPANVTSTTASLAYYLFDTSFGQIVGSLADPRAGLNLPWAGISVESDGRFVVAGSCYPTGSSAPNACAVRFRAFPSPATRCSLDIDGDGNVSATTDGLISTRVMLGVTGNAVTGGINFPSGATRTSWSAIRNFLVNECGLSLAP